MPYVSTLRPEESSLRFHPSCTNFPENDPEMLCLMILIDDGFDLLLNDPCVFPSLYGQDTFQRQQSFFSRLIRHFINERYDCINICHPSKQRMSKSLDPKQKVRKRIPPFVAIPKMIAVKQSKKPVNPARFVRTKNPSRRSDHSDHTGGMLLYATFVSLKRSPGSWFPHPVCFRSPVLRHAVPRYA